MIAPGELERLRVHLGALEAVTRILGRASEEMYDGEGLEVDVAIEKAYSGLLTLERKARSTLELEEAVASRILG